MRLMSKIRLWLSAFLIGTVITAGCSSDFVETTTNQYSNYKEAVEAGAIQRGWLPQALPESANDIVETHNIDTNELWVKFKFAQADIKTFLSECEKANDLRLPSAGRTKKLATWWPETLTDKNGMQLYNAMQAYRCLEMPHAENSFDAGMILDEKEKIVWYWIEPSESALRFQILSCG